MVAYTYVVADLRTDETLEELPLTCQSFERKVNGGGVLQSSLALGGKSLRGINLPSLLMRPRTLYVYRDDQIVWSGILWRGNRPGGDSVSLSATEMESYFQRRLWSRTGYAPVQVDQLDIARTLVGPAAHDIKVALDPQLSGVLRDRTTEYRAADLHRVFELLDNLSAVENGFDYTIEAEDNGDVRTRWLRFGYPRLGRTAEDSELSWESPGNILSWSDDWDSFTASATTQWEHGAQIGEGDLAAPLTASASSGDNTIPPLEQLSQVHSSVIDQGTLDAYARADLKAAPVPVVTYSAVVRGGGDPVLGSYSPGDEALFQVTDNWWTPQANGDPGLVITLRIMAMSVNPNTDEVTLSLGPMFSA